VLAVLAWMLASTLGHALFLFLTASVIAFTLNPLVRDLQQLRLPRGVGVAIVYLVFAAAVVVGLVALTTVVVDETRSAADRIDAYLTEESGRTGLTGAEEDVERLQAWLNDHGLDSVQVEEQLDDWVASLSAGEISGYAQDALSLAQGAALDVILVLFSWNVGTRAGRSFPSRWSWRNPRRRALSAAASELPRLITCKKSLKAI
jgi:predicted PurR-regulated permease PerM